MDGSDELTAEAIERITRYLDVDCLPAQADVAIIFGTRLPTPADLARQLYQQGRIHLLLLTGGRNPRTGEIEAEAHQQLLLEAGVPASQMVVETASTTTLENVRFGLPLLQQRLTLAPGHHVLVISKWYHCRRAMMTLKRQLPPGIRYYAASYEPTVIPRTDEAVAIRRNSWWQQVASRNLILEEWQKIPRYVQQGHLVEVFWSGDGWM